MRLLCPGPSLRDPYRRSLKDYKGQSKSTILTRLKVCTDASYRSQKPFGSVRPSLSHRPRSSSTKPALSLRAASIPLSSMQAAVKTESKTIEIGSSSYIYDNMDEDSYDPSYLRIKNESQSQSQDSLESLPSTRAVLPDKATTSPIVEDDGDDSDDEEFPDAMQIVLARQEKEKKANALREKKALALAMREKAEQKKPDEDIKGKGREIVMDLDSDPDDLEIEMPRAATPVIKAGPHSPRSHKLMRQLAQRSAKKEYDDEMSESQFHRAGRTFHGAEANVVVNPHVTTKATRPKAPKKKEHAVTKHGVDNVLMEKARQQALLDKMKRMEDWKKRGGTLRHDHAVEESLAQADDEEGQDDRAKDLMNAIQAGAQENNEQDEEDEDEDYIASDEEAILSGDEMGSAEEDENAMDGSSDSEEESIEVKSKQQTDMQSFRDVQQTGDDSDAPDMSADMSSIAPTEVMQSEREDNSDDESEDSPFVAPRTKQARQVITDDEADTGSPADADAGSSGPHQATQYHKFVVKEAAPAFPEFEKIRDISLTQVFGKVGASQAPPQASRAVFDDGEGFSQMFGGDDAEGFSQAVEPTQTGQAMTVDGPLPSVGSLIQTFPHDTDGKYMACIDVPPEW